MNDFNPALISPHRPHCPNCDAPLKSKWENHMVIAWCEYCGSKGTVDTRKCQGSNKMRNFRFNYYETPFEIQDDSGRDKLWYLQATKKWNNRRYPHGK